MLALPTTFLVRRWDDLLEMGRLSSHSIQVFPLTSTVTSKDLAIYALGLCCRKYEMNLNYMPNACTTLKVYEPSLIWVMNDASDRYPFGIMPFNNMQIKEMYIVKFQKEIQGFIEKHNQLLLLAYNCANQFLTEFAASGKELRYPDVPRYVGDWFADNFTSVDLYFKEIVLYLIDRKIEDPDSIANVVGNHMWFLIWDYLIDSIQGGSTVLISHASEAKC